MQRNLKPDEHALLILMLETASRPDLVRQLDTALVSDMNDGGMGSLRFCSEATKMGSVLCEAESTDVDNVPLQLSVNLDEHGRLFELDIWKVDFSPLKSYPQPSTLRFSNP